MSATQELAQPLRTRLLGLAFLANGIGAAVMFVYIGYLIPLFIRAGERAPLGVLNGIALAVYAGIGFPLSMVAAWRYGRPVYDWVVAGGAPDRLTRRRALRLPFMLGRIASVLWGASIPIFMALNLHVSVAFTLAVAATIASGGMTTSSVLYLLSERVLRPVTALALAARQPGRPIAPGVRLRVGMAWSVATAVPVGGILVMAVLAPTADRVTVGDLAGAVGFLAGVSLAVGFVAVMSATRLVAEPLDAVREAMRAVETGDFDVRVAVDDGSEIGMLEAGFNRMAAGLAERERMADLFGRHVGRAVASAALRDEEVALGGEERDVGALFIDVVGSTALAARRPPGEVVALLNAFFAVVVRVVEEHGGLVNKFEGDGALCIFGAPVPRPAPARDALRAARALRAALADEVADVDVGIGVSAGRVVAGNVGAEQRFEYTIVGDPVNEAARLCELAKRRPERLLASQAALERSGDGEAARWALGDEVRLRGRERATRLATPARQ